MKISIITAAFNSGDTIRDTIESVLNQTHKDWELIIKDGGSKDNTIDICREMAKSSGGRIHIISSQDKGIYDAMNQGIEFASGAVIGLLNSDDFYTSKDILETISETFERTGCDAVYGDIHYVNDGDLDKIVRYYSSASFKRERMMQGWMPAHPSVYCRREVYRQYGLFDTSFKVAADFEQLLRLIYINNITVQYIPKDFVTMRLGGASTAGLKARIVIMKEILQGFKKNGIRNNFFRLSTRYFSKLLEYGKKH